ncbi:MAG: barstar family protein [Lachnospiraceae bacterium]|nr:barstar family protein [Lachnospiraceae bacterium]
MQKILLDFRTMNTKRQVQEYLMMKLGFPDYYGKNLDALFDMLTERGEDTCVGVFGIREREESPDSLTVYFRQLVRVLREAENENPHLCVFFAAYEDNFEE